MSSSTKQTYYTTMESPIGELLLGGDGDNLSGMYMQDGRKPKTIAAGWQQSAAPLADTKTQLEEYFAGNRTTFEIPLAAFFDLGGFDPDMVDHQAVIGD